MDGADTFARLRTEYPNLKVLFCSGYAQDGPPEKPFPAGAAEFIQKPFDSAALEKAVAKAMAGQ